MASSDTTGANDVKPVAFQDTGPGVAVVSLLASHSALGRRRYTTAVAKDL